MSNVFIESYLVILTRRILYFRGSVIILASFLCFQRSLIWKTFQRRLIWRMCVQFSSLCLLRKYLVGKGKLPDSRIKFKVVNLIKEVKILALSRCLFAFEYLHIDNFGYLRSLPCLRLAGCGRLTRKKIT